MHEYRKMTLAINHVGKRGTKRAIIVQHALQAEQ
jgi:hypothetical protein